MNNVISSSTNTNNNYGTKFYVPVKWNEKIDKQSFLQYTLRLKRDQIVINDLKNLEEKNDMASKEPKCLTENEIIEERVNIVHSLIKICKRFNFKNETLYRAISVFDNFLSKSLKPITNYEELKLISIVCLSLSCKLEEINCNYLIFFKENLIEENTYEVKDLIEKEMEILKTLQFKLNFPHFYFFNNVVMQIAISNIYKQSETEIPENKEHLDSLCMELARHNEFITKKYVVNKHSIFISPMGSGITCFKMTLLSMKYNGNLDTAKINQFVDHEFLSFILEGEYLRKCDFLSNNIFESFAKQEIDKDSTLDASMDSKLE